MTPLSVYFSADGRGFPDPDTCRRKADDTAAISVINRALVGSYGYRACMLAKLLEVW